MFAALLTGLFIKRQRNTTPPNHHVKPDNIGRPIPLNAERLFLRDLQIGSVTFGVTGFCGCVTGDLFSVHHRLYGAAIVLSVVGICLIGYSISSAYGGNAAQRRRRQLQLMPISGKPFSQHREAWLILCVLNASAWLVGSTSITESSIYREPYRATAAVLVLFLFAPAASVYLILRTVWELRRSRVLARK